MTDPIFISRNMICAWPGPAGDRLIYRVLEVDERKAQVALFEILNKRALPTWIGFADLLDRLGLPGSEHDLNDDWAADLRPDEELSEASIKVRNSRMAVLRPLLMRTEDGSSPILHPVSRSALIAGAVEATGTSKDKIYAWLRLWWLKGQLENALLSAYGRCGTGQRRPGKRKLGRPRIITLEAPDRTGMNVTEKDRQLIIRGAKRFWNHRRGRACQTKPEAYQRTLETFYYKRLELKDGVLTPIIHEAPGDENHYPSFEQWNYWVEKHLKDAGALAERYSSNEIALKRRPVTGTSQHLSTGPGQLFLVDATVTDAYLVSSLDPRWTIGRAVLYLVIDHFSRMIVGLWVGVEGPSWIGAMQALENAFTDKVEFCARFGIEIEREAWPTDVIPAQLTADRGEFLSKHADWIVPGLGMEIANTPPFRADFKSFVEGQFKITNEKGIRRIPGYVDRLRDRGGPDYRADALYTTYDFTKLLIRLALHNNQNRELTSNIPPGYPIEDDAQPVPLELWNWGLVNANPSIRRRPADQIRRNLLPTEEAITTRQGLSVFGGRLHYTCETAEREAWFFRAPNRGGRKHKLAIDTRDVAKAYLRSAGGAVIEKCTLTPAHLERYSGKSLDDVLDEIDRASLRKSASRGRKTQKDADLHAQIDAITEEAKERRRTQLGADAALPVRTDAIRPFRKAERDVMRVEAGEAGEAGDQNAPTAGPIRSDPDDDEIVPLPD